MNLNELENSASDLKKLGRKITDSLNIHSDRLGFYRTSHGMKTQSGVARMILDQVKEALDIAAEPVISGSYETKDQI